MNESYLTPQIGFATSTDGANWTRSPNNPVLVPGGSGSWDSAGVEQPNVVLYGNSYLLYYDGFSNDAGGRIGLAQNSRSIAVPEFPVSPYELLSGLVLCVALCFIRRRSKVVLDDSNQFVEEMSFVETALSSAWIANLHLEEANQQQICNKFNDYDIGHQRDFVFPPGRNLS